MILNLFPHLKGHKVLHGSPGYETPETIKSIRTDRIKKSFLTLEFDSGVFTYINKEDFDKFLEEGKVYFQRAAGFTYINKEDFDKFLEEGKVYFQRAAGFEAAESLIDLSN